MGGGKKKKEPPLPSMTLIEHEVDQQQHGKDGRHLIDTNLVILGKGNNVLLASDDLIDQLSVRTDVEKLIPPPVPDSTPVTVPTPNPTPNPNPTPTPTPGGIPCGDLLSF